MAMKTDDYMELGRADARKPKAERLGYTRDNTSWQALAYWAGFDAIAHGKTNLALPTKIEHPADTYFKNWPSAAREHVRCLAKDIADEENEARRARLMKSLGRMTKRHGLSTPYEGQQA